jgi:hypothetical protein
MHQFKKSVEQLHAVRNKYGIKYADQKLRLLNELGFKLLKNTKDLRSLHSTLLFLLAYPDNKIVYKQVSQCLKALQILIRSDEKIKTALYNSGISHTNLCTSFSFELVKWMRKNYPDDIRLSDIEAETGQISSILSVVMPKVESEILQDANADWRSWLMQSSTNEDELLDQLIAVFDETNIRPEIKDELWAALGINVEICFSQHTVLPENLFVPCSHRSLINKNTINQQPVVKPVSVKLTEQDADQVIACGRIVLMRQLREIDPITFTSAKLVSYYQLSRGISVALMGMMAERRHPIDSYMGYVVFKNGLPVAYAGSWILFDSARIGFNVFPEYRGGESQYIFREVLNLHRKVYNLKRFTVDPYQIGKDNSDGIKSGAFWLYYHAGFRPLENTQRQIASAEAKKISVIPGYRTAASVLKKLAGCRMEWVMQKHAVDFDAVDISLAYARILQDQFNNDRREARTYSLIKLENRLQLKNSQDIRMHFILANWCVLLNNRRMRLINNTATRKKLKKLFELKAKGSEEAYIKSMQQFGVLRVYLKTLIIPNV